LRETPQLFPVLRGLLLFYIVRGKLRTAHEVAEQLMRLAQSVQNPALLVEAHYALGVTLFWLGELASARGYLEQSIALYDPQKHRPHAFLYGQDPGVICLSRVAWVLWFLGYPDQALKRIHEALTLAQKLSHPFSIAYYLTYAAWLHQFRREEQATQEWAEALIKLSSEQGFAYWLAWGTILRGWALAKQGQEEEGIAEMRQGLALSRATGAELARSHLLALLAEVYGEGGQAEEGLTLLAEAMEVATNSGERWPEAELYRLNGELLLTLSAENQAESASSSDETGEACFRRAIEVARRQSAKSLELRAVMSLSRLWQKQGKKDEARQKLTEIYDWFTEGFETTDLKEAKSLLEELS